MGCKITVYMETEDVDPVTLTKERLVLGWAELDQQSPSRVLPFSLRQIPEILHQIADQLESGMTTGPDEATWLEPQCNKPVLVEEDPEGLYVHRAPCNKAPDHEGECGVEP